MTPVREGNPYSMALEESICHFSFFSKSAMCVNPDLFEAWCEKPGFLNYSIEGSKLSFDISHAAIDAFGGMSIASQVFQKMRSPKLREQIEVSSAIGEFRYQQYSATSSTDFKNSTKSFSQIFLERALPIFSEHSLQSVAIPVRLDSLHQIGPAEVWGNSFIIVELRLNALEEMVRLPKVEWAKSLHDRALRTLEVGRRRPSRGLSSPVLISLIGDISKFSWFSESFNPLTFQMIPTPKDSESTNLVLWSRGSTHGFVHCAHQSRMNSWMNPLLSIWQEILR